jgi:hypothetical protein
MDDSTHSCAVAWVSLSSQMIMPPHPYVHAFRTIWPHSVKSITTTTTTTTTSKLLRKKKKKILTRSSVWFSLLKMVTGRKGNYKVGQRIIPSSASHVLDNGRKTAEDIVAGVGNISIVSSQPKRGSRSPNTKYERQLRHQQQSLK